MRIVHVLHGKVNPDTANGVSKVGHWMATHQVRLGHDAEIWGLAASMNTADRIREHVREYRMRLFPTTRMRVTLSSELKTELDRLETGTWVHFHSVFCPEFPAIAARLRRRRICYGVTPHGGYSPGVMEKDRFRKALYVSMRERPYLAGASWIQATGAGEIDDILSIAPNARVGLIQNGQALDLPHKVAIEPTEPIEPMEPRHPVIGYCGRLAIRQKGLDFLLAGFAAYKAKGGSGQLWLIGDHADRPAVEQMAAAGGFAGDVKFFGFLNGTAKLEVMANFDAFIHSSRWEGMPTACLEAASLGKPLLVSRQTNLAEFVERSGAGLVLDETSAAGVARLLERVQQIYDHNGLRQMGENARLLIEREFSWEGNARSFIAAIASAGHSL
jgi:glycosyltransferase involved in cell wall biosynthesis